MRFQFRLSVSLAQRTSAAPVFHHMAQGKVVSFYPLRVYDKGAVLPNMPRHKEDR